MKDLLYYSKLTYLIHYLNVFSNYTSSKKYNHKSTFNIHLQMNGLLIRAGLQHTRKKGASLYCVLLGLGTGFFLQIFLFKSKKIVQMSYLSCNWCNWYFRNVVKFPPPWSNMLTLAHLKFCTDITFLSAFFLFLPIWVCTVLCTLRTFVSQKLIILSLLKNLNFCTTGYCSYKYCKGNMRLAAHKTQLEKFYMCQNKSVCRF